MKTSKFAPMFVLIAAFSGTACSADDTVDAVNAVDQISVESGACKVEYQASDWGSGFSSVVLVTNKSLQAKPGSWKLEWDYPSGQIKGAWDAKASQAGSHVTVTGVDWNAILPSGSSVRFGFNGSGAHKTPVDFKLNGVSCDGGVSDDDDPKGDRSGNEDPGSDNPDQGGQDDPTDGTNCNFPEWRAGQTYKVGATVKFTDGKLYKAVHENPGYDPVISEWFWDPYTQSDCGGGNSGDGADGPKDNGDTTGPVNPGTGNGFGAIVSEATFNAMFPARNAFYTYQGLLKAAGTFKEFANTGDEATRKREVAAFLANMAHETLDLIYIEEIAKGDYCQPSPGCPCAPGKRYFGRGPIQLSWNYNYCAAGAALGLPLQADPDLVARDATVAWQTGLWFWMTQSGAGRQSAHANITGSFGFGETIRTINGGLECYGAGTADARVAKRVNNYVEFCRQLNVDPGPNLGC